MNDKKELRAVKCPKCGKKGLHYANHPHAFGWKDYSAIECRFCNTKFNASKLIKYIEEHSKIE